MASFTEKQFQMVERRLDAAFEAACNDLAKDIYLLPFIRLNDEQQTRIDGLMEEIISSIDEQEEEEDGTF